MPINNPRKTNGRTALTIPCMTTTTFSSLNLTKPVQEAIDSLGFTTPTPIQLEAIPKGNEGRDLLAAAQTGTGKTLAYLIPLFDKLVRHFGSTRPKKGGPYVLILAPTRELAQQISDSATAFGDTTHFRVHTVIGGKKYKTQIQNLKRGCDVLIATPGRLNDLLDQKILNLNKVHYLVLDEVDRMMDMGFWPSVHLIVEQTPKKRQTFLLSATLTPEVKAKARTMQHNPCVIEIAHKGETAATVKEYVLPITQRQKHDLLIALLREKGSKRVIVFTKTKIDADSCSRRLQDAGIEADSIHADKPQNKRDKALKRFKNGTIDVLVATDVLARGIDVTGVAFVVNMTVPESPEDYIHRIGRTGRAGEEGAAYTMLSPDQLLALREIEYHTKHLLETLDVPGFSYEPGRLVPDPKRPTIRGALRRPGARRLRIGRR